MSASELRQKNPAELEGVLLELRKEQFNLRMQQGTGQLSRPSEMRRVRKEIARVKTLLNEKGVGEAS
ncbi:MULTISPECIES: 50S ribosomal protein L29 [Sedimenticola]|uniref:Large ribosomal subunit protein uL29 n=1 Tax=Sedimenticola selenatireducens TaxID=191960 RepID=A0A2N6CY66_9GAMM|nr:MULTISPECIES: 50S ribosomal protein L29 [Sedimenticola]MCW8902800.1 50S ribosomal protein L29 [Sedimenticola sp.]PLX62278.1 MAG: 50S ribosomal protein L29 [Sedimenticola selenatireducens]